VDHGWLVDWGDLAEKWKKWGILGKQDELILRERNRNISRASLPGHEGLVRQDRNWDSLIEFFSKAPIGLVDDVNGMSQE